VALVEHARIETALEEIKTLSKKTTAYSARASFSSTGKTDEGYTYKMLGKGFLKGDQKSGHQILSLQLEIPRKTKYKKITAVGPEFLWISKRELCELTTSGCAQISSDS